MLAQHRTLKFYRAGHYGNLELVLVLVAVTLILFIRKPDSFVHPQFWAEDGVLFFAQAYTDGLRAIFFPTNGYLHIVGRLFAALSMLFPLRYAPAVFNYSGLIVTWFIVLYLYSERIKLPWKPLLAITVVGIPIPTGEVFMNLTNLQWVLALSLPLLLISNEPQTSVGRSYDRIILVLAGLTGPFVLIFLPLFFLRALNEKSSHRWILLLLASACATVQSFGVHEVIAKADGDTRPGVYAAVLARQLGYPFFGQYAQVLDFEFPKSVAIIALGICGYFYLFIQSYRHRSFEQCLLLLAGVLVTASTFAKFHSAPEQLYPTGPRYFYIPSVIVIGNWIILAGQGQIFGRFVISTVFGILLCTDTGFQTPPLRNLHWSRYSKCITQREKPICRIPIHPKGWTITAIPRQSSW